MRLLPCTSHTRAGVSTGMGQYTAAVIDAIRVVCKESMGGLCLSCGTYRRILRHADLIQQEHSRCGCYATVSLWATPSGGSFGDWLVA
jgi:hypothetical protein